MALQLSRRGWNNVLIFSALAFISIFQFSHNRLFENSSGSSFPIAADAVVMEIRLPERTFQRVGSGWRSSDQQWQKDQIESWLALFQQEYSLTEANSEPLGEHIIQLYLLAQADPVVFFWQPEQQLLYSSNHESAWKIEGQSAELLNRTVMVR